VSLAPSRSAAVASTWDTLLKRLTGGSKDALDRVRRAVARHTRAAVDEGPLQASDGTVATLVFAVACSSDADASCAETLAGAAAVAASDPLVMRACAIYDPRLAPGRAEWAAFEACVRLAALAQVGPIAWERLREAAEILSGPELALTLLRPLKTSLFPAGDEGATSAASSRRMAQLDRAELDALVAKDPRELAATLARLDRARPGDRGGTARGQVDRIVADVARLLSHPGVLVLGVPPTEPPIDDDSPQNLRVSKPSWLPLDWASPESAAESFADALERGALTLPRLRAHILSGGEPALDAVGAEMLHVAAHPFASAGFAEILARSARPRDIIRLVTYFAIAPDPAPAARALSACAAPELPRVLNAWLEAMLPADGGTAVLGDDDPEHSSAARLTACVASLAPYPHLYRAVRPLLSRVSEAPPPASN
jgi:hypothetical protein